MSSHTYIILLLKPTKKDMKKKKVMFEWDKKKSIIMALPKKIKKIGGALINKLMLMNMCMHYLQQKESLRV